jgi:hypothetical protein
MKKRMKPHKPSREDIFVAMYSSNLLQLLWSTNPQLGILAKSINPITWQGFISSKEALELSTIIQFRMGLATISPLRFRWHNFVDAGEMAMQLTSSCSSSTATLIFLDAARVNMVCAL